MKRSPTLQEIPLDIVGSTTFGRYPKISITQTFNMIISDDFLVPYAGHRNVATIAPTGVGRGIYSSSKYKHLIFVIDNVIYRANTNLAVSVIGTLNTSDGDVFIAENNADQIAICDKKDIWIFTYTVGASTPFQKAVLDFLPGYISFQGGYFISPASDSSSWRLSEPNDGTQWPFLAQNVGEFETKADIPQAAIPFPGRGNLLTIFGRTVGESWYNVGLQLFPYQKSTFYNLDFGTPNPATIAFNEDIIVWLASNERTGPIIMYTDGGDPQQISNDGINFLFANLKNPTNSYGFLFKQDGHLLYQLTFPDAQDNLSLVFDFNTKKFFTLTDEYMNFHIAKRVVFFNNSYYFVSFRDGNLYELSTKYTTYNGAEIPRVRVCKNIRLPDSSRFVVNNLNFTLEQGLNYIPTLDTSTQDNVDAKYAAQQAIDFSFSIDGGASFSSYERKILNTIGRRQNRIDFWSKGLANDFVPQFRFYGMERFVATNGVVSIYQ